MDAEVLKNYKKAQSISNSTIIYAKTLLKEGAKIVEVADKIEDKIIELGGRIGFPLNISINDVAAHYTPDINDTVVFKAGDLVKVDVGVHVEGYIWDKAFSVCIGQKKHPLIEASEKALSEALKLVKPGTKVFEISEVVESTVEEFGFNPIRNLCGHGLERYNTHTAPSIPNGRNNIQDEIQPNRAMAMEVFTTDGGGWVKESDRSLIFSFLQNKPVRMREARQILQLSANDFETLPFAKRWLAKKKYNLSELKIDMALRQLLDVDAIRQYPILKEESGGLVAQTEDSVILE
jgi:methionyl aminopeptidase